MGCFFMIIFLARLTGTSLAWPGGRGAADGFVGCSWGKRCSCSLRPASSTSPSRRSGPTPPNDLPEPLAFSFEKYYADVLCTPSPSDSSPGSFLASAALPAADDWKLPPDAEESPAVPKGTVTKMPPWESQIFEKTVRDWSVYVPAQYKPDGTAAVMVFQDGHDYVNVKGHWRVPIVFDNLIARGDMPPHRRHFRGPAARAADKPKPPSPWNNSNRSLEYDSLGDRYARFLLEEILPEVEKQWPLSHDPEKRAICGASSGGICSFTVAWERPNEFRKVLSTIGSFVNLRGGNVYPSLIRKTEPKPIRVFLQDSSGDLDNPFGNWPISSQQMASALKYMGYDVQFDYTEGYGHNSNRGGSIFPDALKWLWRKETAHPEINTKGDLGGDLTLLKLLIPGEGWQMVADGFGFTDGPCSDEQAQLLLLRSQGQRHLPHWPRRRKDQAGRRTRQRTEMAVPGRIYACQGSKKRLVMIDWPADWRSADRAGGAVTVLAENVEPNDLAVSKDGLIYFTDTGKHQVMLFDPKTKSVRAVDTGIAGPNGLAFSPDGGTLAVSDYSGELSPPSPCRPTAASPPKRPT